MKRRVSIPVAVAVVLMAVGSVALFASCGAEHISLSDDAGPRALRGRAAFDEDQSAPANADFSGIELTGTVSFVDDHAVLSADGKTYLLAIPRIAWYQDVITEGAEITVRGNLVEGLEHEEVAFDGDGYVSVQEVEVNGEAIAVGGRGNGGTTANGGNAGNAGTGAGGDGAVRGANATGVENGREAATGGGRFGRGRMAGNEETGRGRMTDDAERGRGSQDRGPTT